MNPIGKIICNCKQATILIEKKAITKLSFRENIELHTHLQGCSFCRLYSRQSLLINEMVREVFSDSVANIRLDDDFKKVLRERIEVQLNKNHDTL